MLPFAHFWTGKMSHNKKMRETGAFFLYPCSILSKSFGHTASAFFGSWQEWHLCGQSACQRGCVLSRGGQEQSLSVFYGSWTIVLSFSSHLFWVRGGKCFLAFWARPGLCSDWIQTSSVFFGLSVSNTEHSQRPWRLVIRKSFFQQQGSRVTCRPWWFYGPHQWWLHPGELFYQGFSRCHVKRIGKVLRLYQSNLLLLGVRSKEILYEEK